MRPMLHVDWRGIFVPDVPIAEIFVRGTLLYLSLFVLLRLVLKRETGGVSITDLLVIVLIADASQNAMAADYKSLSDGLVLVATLLFWSYALDWLGYRFPWIRRYVHPPPLPLVQDGRILRRNLRQELLTEDELMSQLRLQGVDDIGNVKRAYMEADGRISVIEYEGSPHRVPEHRAGA